MADSMDETLDSSVLEIDGEDSTVNTTEINEEDEMLLLSSSSESDIEDSKDKGLQNLPSQTGISNIQKAMIIGVDNTDDSDDAVILDDDEEDEEDDDEEDDDEEDEDDDVEIIDSEDSVEDTDESEILDGKVQIFLSHCGLFIWNAEDVQVLREECRIIGKLSGCLPSAPRQNNQLGLPLQLMPEEAKLLQEIGAAEIVEEEEVSKEELVERKEAFDTMRRENFEVQQKLYKVHRKEEVTQRFDQIVAAKKAKKRKLQETAEGEQDEPKPEGSKTDTDKEEGDHVGGKDKSPNKEDENDADDDKEEGEDKLTVDDLVTAETSTKHCLVQIFIENPWKRKCCRARKWIFPVTETERLRYAVFRDLWKKGFFLTSGSKFGGDFLVYPGDPSKFHSHFIVVCKDREEDVASLEFVALGRLGSNVRKTTLLCSFNRKRQVVYLSLQWSGIT